jgi:predicted N-acetyltransferase YhbS
VIIRTAGDADVDEIVSLVNTAYEVERFFVEGDRTSVEAIRADLASGTILVAHRSGEPLVGCVYVAIGLPRAYFGLLAVSPAEQGHGLGRRLIESTEDHARSAGAAVMDITVVSVRPDLMTFYSRLGYLVAGTEPYVHRPVLMPVHFVKMAKEL